MNFVNERLFSLLADIWTDKEKEEARHFCDCGDPTITSLYVFNALQNIMLKYLKTLKKI